MNAFFLLVVAAVVALRPSTNSLNDPTHKSMSSATPGVLRTDAVDASKAVDGKKAGKKRSVRKFTTALVAAAGLLGMAAKYVIAQRAFIVAAAATGSNTGLLGAVEVLAVGAPPSALLLAGFK